MQPKTIKAKLAQVRRPPWQLLMTSVSDDAPAPIAGTNSAPQPHLRTIPATPQPYLFKPPAAISA